MVVVEDTHELQPYTIVRQDGTSETVYIKGNPVKTKLTVRDHLTMAYVIVGTLALGMTALFTYVQLKKMKQ